MAKRRGFAITDYIVNDSRRVEKSHVGDKGNT